LQTLGTAEAMAPEDEGRELQKLTEQTVRMNPFVERTNLLWDVSYQGVLDARAAVRMHRDADGNVVIDGRDFGALAVMLGQAHRNTELFGKATGLLNEPAPMNMNVIVPCAVQMVDPGAPAPREDAIDCEVDPAEFPPRSG
jgi:hypothetical protein